MNEEGVRRSRGGGGRREGEEGEGIKGRRRLRGGKDELESKRKQRIVN